MTNKISRLAAATLAVLVLAATYNVHAVQAQKKAPTPPLITTACNYGQVTECGSEPAHTECTREWKIDFGWLTKTFGIGVSEEVCVQIGEKKLYKDYRQGLSSGTCVTYPVIGLDALIVRPRLDDEQFTDEDASCS